MNLQDPSDLRKPDASQPGKSRAHQMIRTALLVTFSSLRILLFLIVRGYRFWLEPDRTEAGFLLTSNISSITTAALLCSGSPNSLLKYTTISKICSVLTLTFEQQYRFFSQLPLEFIYYLNYIYFTFWTGANRCERLFDQTTLPTNPIPSFLTYF